MGRKRLSTRCFGLACSACKEVDKRCRSMHVRAWRPRPEAREHHHVAVLSSEKVQVNLTRAKALRETRLRLTIGRVARKHAELMLGASVGRSRMPTTPLSAALASGLDQRACARARTFGRVLSGQRQPLVVSCLLAAAQIAASSRATAEMRRASKQAELVPLPDRFVSASGRTQASIVIAVALRLAASATLTAKTTRLRATLASRGSAASHRRAHNWALCSVAKRCLA
jgi:hypothetical protein